MWICSFPIQLFHYTMKTSRLDCHKSLIFYRFLRIVHSLIEPGSCCVFIMTSINRLTSIRWFTWRHLTGILDPNDINCITDGTDFLLASVAFSWTFQQTSCELNPSVSAYLGCWLTSVWHQLRIATRLSGYHPFRPKEHFEIDTRLI